ncbi:transglycosylase domain-containing protein [Sporosarcina pasteurii]|uniref:transglycosylase domain-containing protein n=1 Tax=Sporosarcina pasteurii TaxID=1474 RepID=UPI001FB931BD|nr:transglycosylase domain-containing protein [Sporosarcina pasteurii]
MSDKIKSYLKYIEDKINNFTEKSWAKKLRITSGVAWNLFLLFIVSCITLFVFAASVGAGYFASLVAEEPLRSKEEMRDDILTYEESSEIFLANNVYLGKVNADIERKEIKLEDVSPYVIDAVLATEDEYFETHPGIVPKAVFRGIFQDVTNSASQTGGSTLTQQLIKLQILTNEVSYERKAKEILLALRLEKFMDKHEILEAYLNVIPYGRNANGDNIAGVEAAAEGIFNVNAKDLNLPQAAFIAGIPQAPYAHTPFYNQGRGLKEPDHLKPGIDRMKTVLFRMKETGYITEKQYEEAIAYDITRDFREKELRANERYPYLTQEIQRQTVEVLSKMLTEEEGIDPNRLDVESKLKDKYNILARRAMTTNGYRIHSTINKDIFDRMNEAAKSFEHYGYTYTSKSIDPDTGEEIITQDPVQVGSVMIENRTGKILSFVGGRDFNIRNFNFATQGFRQNGSAMKPLLVYAPAIELGYIGAGSPVVDVKFSAGGWSPSNFQATQELGIIPARQALATSQNLATVRLFNAIKERDPAQFLKLMGFSRLSDAESQNLSLSLGAMTDGTSVEEMVNAYATFANAGQFIDAYMIEKIEDMEGNIVYEHKVEPVEVFSPETAYIISDMLRDVAKHGTATTMRNNLNFSMDIAAKTGTTDKYIDNWLVGYNPNVSLGVWLGYRDHKKGLYPNSLRNSYLPPSRRTNLLFARLMNAANAAAPDIVGANSTFTRPEGVVSRSFCGISGLAPSKICSDAGLVKTDLFNAKVFVPSKADDSIISSSYVSVKGKKYLALPNTPSEFIVQGGTGVNEEFISRMFGSLKGDASKLFPANSPFASSVVSGAKFNADSANPAAVNAKVDGTSMSWTESSSNDVIGYYVYRNDSKVATVRDGEKKSYTISDGTYTVRAVDITGRLSEPSNAIKIKEAEDKEKKEKEEKEKEKVNEKDKTPPKEDKPKDEGKPDNGNADKDRDEGKDEDKGKDDDKETPPEEDQDN